MCSSLTTLQLKRLKFTILWGDIVHDVVSWSCGSSDDFVVTAHELDKFNAVDEIDQNYFSPFTSLDKLFVAWMDSFGESFTILSCVWRRLETLRSYDGLAFLTHHLRWTVDGHWLCSMFSTLRFIGLVGQPGRTSSVLLDEFAATFCFRLSLARWIFIFRLYLKISTILTLFARVWPLTGDSRDSIRLKSARLIFTILLLTDHYMT